MTTGLRERKKQRRRERITDCALRLFAERGFEGATIDDIAAAADVSRRTFFRYFARKEDVILDWKRAIAAELGAALAARPPKEPPLQAVHGALAGVVAGYAAQPELTLGLLRLSDSGLRLAAGEDYPDWAEVLAAGVAERLGVDPAGDPRPQLTAKVGLAILEASVHTWATAGGDDDLLELLAEGFAAVPALG
jgi:AcrR family transcriptional regulator